MANIKITEMPQATSVGGDDITPIVQDGVNKQASKKLLDTYSTSEQVVGTWIDGKPIYRMVIIGDNYQVTNNAISLMNSSQVTSLNIEMVVNVSVAVGTKNSGGDAWRGNYLNSNYYSGYQINNAGGFFVFVNDNNQSSVKAKAIIEYTKTTDSVS